MSAGLTREGSILRQERLRKLLADEKLDSALICDPRHIYYFTGYWRNGRVLTSAALLVDREGSTTLVCPEIPEPAVLVDDVVTYEAQRLSTLVDDPELELWRMIKSHVDLTGDVGTDSAPFNFTRESSGVRSLSAAIRALRRAKDRDEVDMLRTGIAGCDAAYARARDLLESGVTEVELYASMRAAATGAVGVPLTDFGNDFQCGALGSLPRDRKVQTGDSAILDVGVVHHGYSSDLCRTFVVGREPSEAQAAAHGRIMSALRYVEETVRPGIGCKSVYEEVHAMIDGFRGWKFPHHLGHGIGLSAHEAPRLNPHWDDTFEVGDVFTAEPGLYGDDLRAGIRIENDYLVTPGGVERLSYFSTDLA